MIHKMYKKITKNTQTQTQKQTNQQQISEILVKFRIFTKTNKSTINKWNLEYLQKQTLNTIIYKQRK